MIRALQEFFGVEHVVPVGRGALAIYSAIRSWSGAGPVAVPASICQDVIAAVLMAGREPFFCDVDPTTGLVPRAEWTRARTASASIAIVVHLYGNPADTTIVREIFPVNDCLLIDDAAQALGTQTNAGLAGTCGDVGVISFGHTKHIAVGGAALLCRDSGLARECERVIHTVIPEGKSETIAVMSAFQASFQSARERLISTGDVGGFAGLLDGYEPVLRVVWRREWCAEIKVAIRDYPDMLAARCEKALRWERAIKGTGLLPLGMSVVGGCVPWRYACHLPGCDWERQNALGECMRRNGMHVSHWYLPAHWLLGLPMRSLPGSEVLAQEVFQFWLDDRTSINEIEQAELVLRKCLGTKETDDEYY